MVTEAQIREALRGVNDPEIGRPIEDIGMLERIEVDGGTVRVHVLLTIEGCPLRDRITQEVTAAVQPIAGVERVEVSLTPMSPEQREKLVGTLRGPNAAGPTKIAFSPKTSIIAVASGKGGVGKSSVTVNLAASLAADGYKVGRARRRRLGLQRAAHARRRGQAGRVQRHDPAAGGPRREGDLDGVLRAGGHPGDLARADAAQGDRAVPGRRLLGRSRRACSATCPRHRRREHLARIVHPGRLDGRGHDAAGGGAHGRAARREDGRTNEPAPDRRDREHVVVRLSALRRAGAAVRRGRRAAGGRHHRRAR